MFPMLQDEAYELNLGALYEITEMLATNREQ